jgi:hypothetical protein
VGIILPQNKEAEMSELQEMKRQTPWLVGYRVRVAIRTSEGVAGNVAGTLSIGSRGWFIVKANADTWLCFSVNQIVYSDYKERWIEIDLSLEG